jgi:hypothetical protein
MLKKTLSPVLIVDDLVEIVNDYYYDYSDIKRLLILSLHISFEYFKIMCRENNIEYQNIRKYSSIKFQKVY